MNPLLNRRTPDRNSLLLLTLNTGHGAQCDLRQLSQDPPLQLLAFPDSDLFLVPEWPGFTLRLVEHHGGAAFLIQYLDAAVALGSVAWEEQTGKRLWAHLRECYEEGVPEIPDWKHPCPAVQPPRPWVAVALNPNAILIGDEAFAKLGALARRLARTLLHTVPNPRSSSLRDEHKSN